MTHRVDAAERLRAELFPRLDWAEDLSGRRFAIVGAFERFPRYLGRTPAEAVLGRGGVVEDAVTAGLDYAVFGNGRGKGKAEAQRQAEKLAASGKPAVLDEAGFIHLLRPKLDGARFHVAGELDFGRGAAATAPAALVLTLGGVYADRVDAQLDYLVVGQRRGPGKAAALAAAEKLMAGGARLQLLSEDMFIDLLRAHAGAATQPVQAASPLAELVAALPSVTDAGRIKRALDMLKRERMQLFTEVADEHIAGIVRSQTGYSEYYSTRLHADGRYSCCEPPAATARAWLAAAQQPKSRKSAGGAPIKDLLSETILRYQAATAGELDWRPLETVPEDFYAF